MTVLALPVSTSQAIVGGILGIGIASQGFAGVDWYRLLKIVICWVATPIGAAIFSYILYRIFAPLFNYIYARNIGLGDTIIKILTLIIGAYGAYSLGANNVANVTGIYLGLPVFGEGTTFDTFWATLIGGSAIALGVLTFSKRVMYTVGENIVLLEPFTSLIAVLSEAITVFIFAIIGVPVSTSQAIVGAVMGIGFVKGISTVKWSTIRNIAVGWITTPTIAGIIAYIITIIFV